MLWNIAGRRIAGELENDPAEHKRDDDEQQRAKRGDEARVHERASVIVAPILPTS